MRNYKTTSPEIERLRRERISQTLKGRTPANLSYLHSIPFTDERRKKIGIAHTGKKYSEETKRKISEGKRKATTPLHKAIRDCHKYRQWRKFILKRDGFACVLCKEMEGILNADHFPTRFVDLIRNSNIKTVAEAHLIEELWNIKNGRTLCLNCHRKTDTFGNRMKIKRK